MSARKKNDTPSDAELGDEAADWLLRFEDTAPDPEDEYPDLKSRNHAFYEWLGISPEHLRVFLETIETHKRLRMIDSRHLIRVEGLLQDRMAEVIQLHKEKERSRRAPASRRKLFEEWTRALPSAPARRRLPLWGAAAALLLVIGGAGCWWWFTDANAYVTKVGEQRSTKLADGSFIFLNTDSKVEVNFSDKARAVRLVRGEALFVVEHDSTRPFTVTAGETSVRAIGTQFNVRRRADGADVAVVEGTVQVTALDEAQKFAAGEEAQVVKGRIAPRANRTVAEAVAWRQRRLVFHDARLADVADEFNRYNKTKIRVEGDAARDIQLSGIFDADRPQALMLYAAKNAQLTVEPEGNDWVIRGR